MLITSQKLAHHNTWSKYLRSSSPNLPASFCPKSSSIHVLLKHFPLSTSLNQVYTCSSEPSSVSPFVWTTAIAFLFQYLLHLETTVLLATPYKTVQICLLPLSSTLSLVTIFLCSLYFNTFKSGMFISVSYAH